MESFDFSAEAYVLPAGGIFGNFTVCFSFTTGAAVFAPLTSLFAERYPRVKFDIQLATGSALPVWYNTDLRVVHDVYNYEDVKEFFLADAVRILCAAPAWIKDHPVSRPKDLERYPVFGARDAVEHRSIRFTRGNKEEAVYFIPKSFAEIIWRHCIVL